jgi:Mn2+/Fe2+ NRAMP family transporter
VDIAVALGIALVVNVAVLLVAAATFHQAGEGAGWWQGLGLLWQCLSCGCLQLCGVEGARRQASQQ